MAKAKKEDAVEIKEAEAKPIVTEGKTWQQIVEERNRAETKPTRKKLVRAAPCPKNPEHTDTRVYSTKGRMRYCICETCAYTWKQPGEAAKTTE